MGKILEQIVYLIAAIHAYILGLNDGIESVFTDKQLHFLVIGVVGMLLFAVVYPLFRGLGRRHIIAVAWIYVFTVLLGLTLAIEVGQKITDTGSMEFADIVFGVAGFLCMFALYWILRMAVIWIRRGVQQHRKKRMEQRVVCAQTFSAAGFEAGIPEIHSYSEDDPAAPMPPYTTPAVSRNVHSGGNHFMDTTLVIMAAGIGSRFGGGIKQLEPVGPNGEIIMDYSIHDALEAGFTKIVFIIRRDLEADFRAVIGNRIDRICKTAYAFQEKTDLPEGFSCPENRQKPWGTGQAVLACRELVREPFAVINADDYYGKSAFVKVHDYLTNARPGVPFDCCMAGFVLKNTLSDNGGVTRGICQVNEQEQLLKVVETHHIVKTAEGAAVEGADGARVPINANAHVSMNMWGLTPDFFGELQSGFVRFLQGLPDGDVKSEYLLPTIIDGLLQQKRATVRLLETTDKWFGVTYKEDKQTVVDSFRALIAAGVYPEKLFDN